MIRADSRYAAASQSSRGFEGARGKKGHKQEMWKKKFLPYDKRFLILLREVATQDELLPWLSHGLAINFSLSLVEK